MQVIFGNAQNHQTESLSFEVVNFNGSYNAILGRPCYTKLMAFPNYVHLKLKMLRDVIVVLGSFLTSYKCDRAAVEHVDNFIA